MWHDPQLSPGLLSTFELLYCRAIVIGQQLSDVCATGLTLARKLQQRCFRQLHPNGLRTCGTRRIFKLVQLNVATPEGSSLPEKWEGLFPIQKMQSPWMQHLTRVVSPFHSLLPCSNMSGKVWLTYNFKELIASMIESCTTFFSHLDRSVGQKGAPLPCG